MLSIYLPSLSGGGAERVMLTLANAFTARGLPVDLVLAKAEGPYLKDVADDLASVIGLERERIEVVYNPIDISHVTTLSKRPLQHPWYIDGSLPLIAAAGRLTRQKNYPMLLHVFALVRAHRPLRLTIIGEGEARGELEALVRKLGLGDDVVMPGFVNNPFVWMHRSSLYVLSSAWEGFGNVLVEAMACGTPVISTDCPSGPAEILENGLWGRLVPVGDVKALADAVVATLDESAYPDVCRRAQDFNVEKTLEGYLRVLEIPLPVHSNKGARV